MRISHLLRILYYHLGFVLIGYSLYIAAAESKLNTSYVAPVEQASGNRTNAKRRALPPARFRDSSDDISYKTVCQQIFTHLLLQAYHVIIVSK